jgi:hypothetical protein
MGRAAARPTHNSRVIRFVYAGTIGLSAFLFFSLQLLAGRLVLPVFGGSAGVWTTALSFFTAVLFVGYAYAHLVATRLTPRHAAVLHVALAGLALTATLFAPANVASLRIAGLPESIAVLATLLGVVGPAALLLSATTPLLSAWYARHSSDPWWLYATSNAASFGALFAYPLLIERLVPLSAQRLGLAGGLSLFLVALLAVLIVGRRAGSRAGSMTLSTAASERLGLRRQALWLAAAFVPAGLLSATTNFITTDLVSAPLLWVGPLATYLASFVIVFSARGRRVLPLFERLVPAAAVLLCLPFVLPVGWPIVPLLLVEIGAFAVLAVAVHGRLAQDRPADAQLTRFYLVIAAGGMLATAFVALLAPLVFTAVWEYPVLIFAALALLLVFRAEVRGPARAERRVLPRGLPGARLRLVAYALVAVALVALLAWQGSDRAMAVTALIGLGGATIVLSALPSSIGLRAALLVTVIAIAVAPITPLAQVRTFYGVIQVRQLEHGRAMYHGTTLHGVQLAAHPREPTSYYAQDGPVGDLVADLHARLRGADIGVVGLGVGTLAAYARPTDRLTFFEIDQGVVDIALDERYFTYLAGAATRPAIVVGDGRLALAGQPDDTFDLLVLDAFSSDTVPVHLLTREALAEYARVVADDGIVAFHVSNRFYELAPALASTARSLGLEALGTAYQPDAELAAELAVQSSRWVAVGAVHAVERLVGRGWTREDDGPMLSDDFPDVTRLLRLE